MGTEAHVYSPRSRERKRVQGNAKEGELERTVLGRAGSSNLGRESHSVATLSTEFSLEKGVKQEKEGKEKTGNKEKPGISDRTTEKRTSKKRREQRTQERRTPHIPKHPRSPDKPPRDKGSRRNWRKRRNAFSSEGSMSEKKKRTLLM